MGCQVRLCNCDECGDSDVEDVDVDNSSPGSQSTTRLMANCGGNYLQCCVTQYNLTATHVICPHFYGVSECVFAP